MRVADPVYDLKNRRAKLRGLLVGVNDYRDRHLMPLRFAVQDCEGFEQALTEATEVFPDTDFVSCLGMAGDVPLMLEMVQARLEELLDEITPKDTFLFYFSGHGVLDADTQQLFLCLTQTQLDRLPETGLSVQSLLNRLKESGVGKQVVILDACHSGSVITGSKGAALLSRSATEPESSSEPDPTFIPKLTETLDQFKSQGQGKDFYALLSCAAAQQSWELPDLNHGAFTHFLIRGLQGEAVKENQPIDVDSLYRYVRDKTEEHVRREWGRQQTPGRITSGHHDIFIGISTATSPESDPFPSGDPFEQEKYYRHVAAELLRKTFPADAATERRLREIAETLQFLSAEEVALVLNDITQRFENALKSYERRAIQLLHGHYPHEADPFIRLRKDSHFDRAVLSRFETQAYEVFHQNRQAYITAFSAAIHREPKLSEATRTELHNLRTQFGFCEAAIAAFEAAAQEELEQHKQVYHEAFALAIHQQDVPDLAPLRQLQQQLALGDAIMQAIEASETELCHRHKQAYRQAVATALHQHLTPDLAPLRQLQQQLGLGDAVVDRIHAEEQEEVDRHKHRYQTGFSDAIREQEHLSARTQRELRALQSELGLGNDVVEAWENEVCRIFEQDQATYEQTYQAALHQEQPLQPSTIARLHQLQSQFKFGAEIVTKLKQKATEVFEYNRQRYGREFVLAIRQQPS